MNQFIGIFLAGGLGSLLRHLVSMVCSAASLQYASLISIGIVNILGSLAAGYAVTRLQDQGMKGIIIIGFLGGFTTFSAFSLELYQAIQKQQYGVAFLFFSLVLVGGFLGVMLAQK